ncbi:Insertion element IS630 uncharacterized 39 kDa protein [Labeo rohita]|uniref:Insertion element IS630 uncharacterized 39 kDa protein n=1 Tax=Labeo rohita TaxID=84645 RepID=A0ABQ8M3J4_LABRO|nr:Insertion element IS630 uncharacterized 39 kDa protein [Labeo rohita]
MEDIAERGRGRGRLRIRGGGRVRGRGRAGRGLHGQRRQTLSNEIRATLVDHVIHHGLTMREAGQRVQPNLSRFTVASVIRTFRLENRTERRHHGGGRGQMFTGGVLEIDAHAIPHEFIFIDEAGFNLAKTRRRGRNVIGHRAIIDVPGQRGGKITMCAAISKRMNDADHQRNRYVVVWDNVSFHRAAPVQNWFADHPTFLMQYLPPYSLFLNPIEEFFSAWRWKVYSRQPFVRMPLVQAMEEACDEIDVGAIQGWIRHSRRFFPRCLAREDIACDVDKALWPNPVVRQDAA